MQPFSVVAQQDTICDVIRRWAEIQPDAPALIEKGKAPLNYAALVRVLDDIRASLHASGLGRGDRVGVVHSGGADMASLVLGVISGASAVPLDPRLTSGEIEIHLRDRKVDALIVERGASQSAVIAARGLNVPIIETRDLHIGDGEWSGIEPLAPKKPRRTGLSEADDAALVLATSGTTGRSKIVARTHRRLLARVAVEEKTTELSPNDIGIVIRPLFYSGPFVNVLSALYTGGAIAVMAKFEAREFFETLRSEGITWYSGGPTFQREIYAHAMAHPHDAANIHLTQIRVGTASLEPEIADGLERLFSTSVSTSYGSTESGRIACICPSIGPRKKGTVGVSIERLGFQGSEVRIRSLDGAFLPVGERGEVVVRGPQVFEGYENDEAANAEAFADGWFRTGDEGFFDTDGYLTLTGRIKEMINRGGEKVSPAEVDAALVAHPDVREAATFPVPHPTLGEEVAVAVVQETGAGLTDQVLTKYLLKTLTGFKVPRRFYFVDQIPKSDAGKVQRNRLAEVLGLETEPGPVRGPVLSRDPTPLETQLQRLWAKALRLPHVGLDENFFLLGGDSLQAVQMFLDIEKALGRRLPRSALFEAGTVVEMAALIEGDKGAGCLVAIQPEGDLPPFFCIHDGNGDVLNFRDLAHHMGKERPFFGIQCVGLDGRSIPLTSLEEMAAQYIKEIRRVQLTGPYFIGGYSFGGRVAYVMAQKLLESGELGMLALLDTNARSGQSKFSWKYWVIRHLARLKKTPISELPAYITMRFRNIVVEFRRGTLTGLYGQAICYFRSRRKAIPQWLYRPIEANDLIRRTTKLSSFAGDAVLFRTAAEVGKSDEDHISSWRSLIQGNLKVVPISGQHYQIVKEPHVRNLAAKLSKTIKVAEERGH